jgi:hypothetical protein
MVNTLGTVGLGILDFYRPKPTGKSRYVKALRCKRDALMQGEVAVVYSRAAEVLPSSVVTELGR